MLLIDTLRSGDYDCARHSNLPLSMPGFLCNLPLSISGFVANQGKSVLSPVEFLEGVVDSKSMTLKLTEERVLKISTLQSNFSQPRDIHS